MNTKLIMTVSAIAMGMAGIILSFLPKETLQFLSATTSTVDVLVLQIMGALYFAFAMINWTAKANLIGGIYGRSIAIGNLTHFVIGGLALLKGYLSSHEQTVLALAAVYILFAVLFSMVFFRHPVKE